MRRMVWLAVVAACGERVDARAGGGSAPPDAASPPPIADAGGDAAALSECAEAALHSELAWIQDHIFTPSCATAMCHTGANAEVGLRLDAGESHANLVGHDASTQTGWVRVVAGSPATSYLVVALGRAAGPMPRDGFMPLGAEALCGEKLDAIERWIAAGAQP